MPRKRRESSSSLKFVTTALQNIAMLHSAIAAPSVHVRRTRSASTPNGIVATAAVSEVTATRRPMSVFVIEPLRSSVADAPTVAKSAPLSPSTHARTTTTRARVAPPRRTSTCDASARPARPVSWSSTWRRLGTP